MLGYGLCLCYLAFLKGYPVLTMLREVMLVHRGAGSRRRRPRVLWCKLQLSGGKPTHGVLLLLRVTLRVLRMLLFLPLLLLHLHLLHLLLLQVRIPRLLLVLHRCEHGVIRTRVHIYIRHISLGAVWTVGWTVGGGCGCGVGCGTS